MGVGCCHPERSEDLLLLVFLFQQQNVSPATRPSSSFLLSKKDGTRKKDTPSLRFQHIPMLKIRARLRVVSTVRPCTGETMIDFLPIALRADPSPPAATQGP